MQDKVRISKIELKSKRHRHHEQTVQVRGACKFVSKIFLHPHSSQLYSLFCPSVVVSLLGMTKKICQHAVLDFGLQLQAVHDCVCTDKLGGADNPAKNLTFEPGNLASPVCVFYYPIGASGINPGR